MCLTEPCPGELVQVLVLVLVPGAAHTGVTDTTCSATTIRTRRDEWIAAGVFAALEQARPETYDKIVGLDLANPCADADANHNDSPLPARPRSACPGSASTCPSASPFASTPTRTAGRQENCRKLAIRTERHIQVTDALITRTNASITHQLIHHA